MPITASCHCGAVRIELSRRPRKLSECTCSICRRYGAKWAYCTGKTAKVSYKPGSIRGYAWGSKSIEFFHCTMCGCLTHYEGAGKSENRRIAVNARMISPADLEGIRVRLFDGADTWKYLD